MAFASTPKRMLARRARAAVAGANIQAGRILAGHVGGGGAKFAFSGLMKCGICGSSMVIVGGTKEWRAYGCAGHKDGGEAVCANGISVRKDILESRLVAPIKTELLSPERIADIDRRVSQKIAQQPKAPNSGPRMQELRTQIENLADAIAAGALKASPALAGRLAATEAELAHLAALAAKPQGKIVDFPARLAARFQKMVERLEEYLARDPNRARAALRGICGEIPVFPDKTGKFLIAKLGLSEMFLEAAVGSERSMVAGVGFEPTTFGL